MTEQDLALPYIGLRPFKETDQQLFFGREAQISALLTQLEEHPFVAVVGSSGSGKSSLVRAGLIPAIREGFLLGTTEWEIVVMKPGHQPYLRLLRKLIKAKLWLQPILETEQTAASSANSDAPTTPHEEDGLAQLLTSDGGLLALFKQSGLSPESRMLLVVDQFEELFAFRRASARSDQVASRDEAAAFVRLLLRTCSEPESPVHVVLTMRSDFIGDCEAFLGLPEAISRSQFLVPRLDRSQMAEAIERPASVKAARYAQFGFEPDLVNRIINDAGDRPDQLPLMQHALMRTWKFAVERCGSTPVMLTSEDYQTACGIEKALSLHADAAWQELPTEARLIAQKLFVLLCDISSDGQITRRRPRVQEVLEVTGATLAELQVIVSVFQCDDRNFLLPPASQILTAETHLDISHEALLRRWERFAKEWQEQERRDASELRLLAELARFKKHREGGNLSWRDLARVEDWKKRVSAAWARRYVSAAEWENVLAYIEVSKRHAIALKAGVVCIFLMLGVVAVVSYGFKNQAQDAETMAKIATVAAERSKNNAQDALVNSYFRTIGVSSFRGRLEFDEPEALWELAELGQANAIVRAKLLERWHQSENSVIRSTLFGRRAVSGLSPAMQTAYSFQATKLADQLLLALENPQETDEDQLSRVIEVLVELVGRMTAEETAGRADRLLTALEKENNTNRLSARAYVLAAFAARMKPAEGARAAARGANRLLTALEYSQSTDRYRFASLASVLANLAAQMEPAEGARSASRGADRLLTILENPQETDNFLLAKLGRVLADLAARMEPAEGARSASRAADRLLANLENSQEPMIGFALAALAPQMEPKDAARAADQLLTALEKPQSTADQVGSNVLAALAARMGSEDAALVTNRLLTAIENPKSTVNRLAHQSVLADFTAQMEPAKRTVAASRGADLLLTILENPQSTDVDQLSNPSGVLAALAAQMEPAERAVAASRGANLLLTILENPQSTDVDQLSSLSGVLAALAAQMEPVDAARGADQLLMALESPKETNPFRVESLGSVVAALAAQMEPAERAVAASRGADRLLTALENIQKTDIALQARLGSALAALAVQMDASKAFHIASRAADRLLMELKDSPQSEADGLWHLSFALVQLLEHLPPAKQTRAVAMSFALLQVIPKHVEGEEEPIERKQMASWAATLTPQELSEVLKWPFCVGEAEQIVLTELEKQTGRKFGGDVWQFVAQAESLGIKNIDAPAKRPNIEGAIQEMAAITRAGATQR